MKGKILLVGRLNDVLGDIKAALDDEYDVQISAIQTRSIQGMLKIVRPSLIVISTVGLFETEPGFASWIDQNTGSTPVIYIVTNDEMYDFRNVCNSERYTYLNPPVNLDVIYDTCTAIIKQDPNYKDRSKVKHILTIDDSPQVLRYIKDVLKDEYDVSLATSGEMGIKKAKETKPDLILLDYEMPEMDGREALLNMKVEKETEKIPVIFLTGVSDPKRVKDVIGMQPAGYILKPVDAAQLIEQVHAALQDK